MSAELKCSEMLWWSDDRKICWQKRIWQKFTHKSSDYKWLDSEGIFIMELCKKSLKKAAFCTAHFEKEVPPCEN